MYMIYCICVYVYVYVYICICIHIYIYTCLHTCTHICMHILPGLLLLCDTSFLQTPPYGFHFVSVVPLWQSVGASRISASLITCGYVFIYSVRHDFLPLFGIIITIISIIIMLSFIDTIQDLGMLLKTMWKEFGVPAVWTRLCSFECLRRSQDVLKIAEWRDRVQGLGFRVSSASADAHLGARRRGCQCVRHSSWRDCCGSLRRLNDSSCKRVTQDRSNNL